MPIISKKSLGDLELKAIQRGREMGISEAHREESIQEIKRLERLSGKQEGIAEGRRQVYSELDEDRQQFIIDLRRKLLADPNPAVASVLIAMDKPAEPPIYQSNPYPAYQGMYAGLGSIGAAAGIYPQRMA